MTSTDDWWDAIDKAAALREQFPPAHIVRATERPALGNLHTKPTPADTITRREATHETDADRFIARMEQRRQEAINELLGMKPRRQHRRTA